MPKRSRTEPDPNVTAFNVVQKATQERPTGQQRLAALIREIGDALDAGESPGALAEQFWPRIQDLAQGNAAATLGRKGGKKGGRARAKKLSPERRSEIAKKAAAARWGRKPSSGDR